MSLWLTEPDAAMIDALARLQLTARRHGSQIWRRHAGRELQDLLALAGLCDVMSLCAPSLLESKGQTEQREQARAEEVVDPDDPSG